MIDVHIIPHPFSARRDSRRVESGTSIEAIVARFQPDPWLARHAHAYLNDVYIPRGNWKAVRPKPGTALSIRLVPMGGGGRKSLLTTVMSVAVFAALQPVGAALAGTMGSALGSKLVTSGFSLLTRLALAAIAPPPKARFSGSAKESQTLFIQGATNEARPFARVPKVLGRHRFVPPLGAAPYTETLGNDQYLRMLFIWGYGPLEVSDLKIGDTPLTDFTGVEVETRQGYSDDAPITLYSDSILQNDLQVALTQASGWVTRTSAADADEISVDVTFPHGLFRFTADGAKATTSASLEVEYAPAGSGAWASAGTIAVSAKQSAALRKGLRFTPPARGQYDVRLRRTTPDSTSDRLFDDTFWTALRTIRHAQPVRMPGLAMTALRIKATDQLSGVIDRFNGVVHSILPDWDGTAWTERATSNPASIFRHVLQGNANARPLADARLDLDRLQMWHENCAAANRLFNTVIDYDVSVAGVISDVAAAGRAAPTLVDGKWAVVEDKVQSVPVQHFTPRNTFGFQGGKEFTAAPQGLRIRFVNAAKGWLQDERLVFADGYDAATATRYETLELPGITDADQAWRDGRYHLAAARLRPETYSFSADIEHIICTRGDLIRFTHDVPMFGLMSARVKSISGAGVTLDAAVTMEAGRDYAIRFRLADGDSLVCAVTTQPGTTSALTLDVAPDGVAAGDLALFGEAGSESVELIVKAIEPQGDLSARLTCVDAAPAIHAADQGALPAWSSRITAPPPELARPPVPLLAQIQSGEDVMIRHADGSYSSRLVVTLQPPGTAQPLELRAAIRAAGETSFHPAAVLTRDTNGLSITDVADGDVYDLRLSYVSAAGLSSAPLVITGYRVTGATNPPPDVQGFTANVLGTTAHLSWSAVADVDLAGYTLRFAPRLTGVTWSSATDLVTAIARDTTAISVPAAAGTYLLKAVDAGGRQSAGAALVVSAVAGLSAYNAVATVAEDGAFVGGKENTGLVDGALRLAGADCLDDWGDLDDVGDADIGNAGIAPAGTYTFAETFDLGATYTSRLTMDLDAVGVDTSRDVDIWADVDALGDWDQSADPALWNVALDLQTTDDDPAGAPVWSAWQPFVTGDYAARAYRFRARLESFGTGVTPAVSRLRVDIDMPDRMAGARGLAAPAEGGRVAFDTPFRAIPAVAVTAQALATGDYYEISEVTPDGFGIRFFDASGGGVARSFDYLAQGYGQQL